MELDDEIVEETKADRISQTSAVRQRVAALILSRTDEEIISFLLKRSKGSTPWQAVLDYARALFYGLGSLAKEDSSSKSAGVLRSTFITIINLISSRSLPVDKQLVNCVSFLVQELEGFPKTLLPSIADTVLSHLESGINQDGADYDDGPINHLLEFIPRCLSLIGSAGSVVIIGEDGEELQTTGIQCRERLLRRLLATPWSKKFVTRMASLLRDLCLELREMEEFVRKLFSHMKDAEPQDLPSLVYQLLLLASKGFKRIVLTGLINFFNKVHAQGSTKKGRASNAHASADAFRQMEGTIVLHINFAVKQDPALGQEWLYLVRTNSWPLTPFLVSVLLSLGRIQRFEQPAFDYLKAAAVKCFRDCQQCRESRWSAAILGVASLQTARRVEESFMRTVQSSAFGWDHLIPSVVHMGFSLVEASGPGRPRLDDIFGPSVSSTQDLGIRVLSAAFEVHEMARDKIIEQCKCRIIGLKPQHSAPILRLIMQLVQNCPQLMLQHSARLKECLDYFSFLHSISASSLLQAISSLFQLSGDLQDYTVLVLRKAMFGREENARMTAVQGLLDLIVSEKQTRASDSESVRARFSEASCSQSSSQIDKFFGRTRNLLYDLLGLLRRCLSQQASVREMLYQGLPKLLQVDPGATETVFDLIWPHFSRYYESDQEGTASLNLDSCVVVQSESVCVVEPLDHLLWCVHQLLALEPQASSWSVSGLSESQDHDQETATLSSGELLAKAFWRLRKSVNKSSLGAFYRDKTLDFSSDTTEGEKNMELARLLLGVVEVLMDSAVSDCMNQEADTRRVEAENELKSYLNLHDSLMNIVTQKPGRSTSKSSEKGEEKKGSGRPPKGNKGRRKAAESKDRSSQPMGKSGAFPVPRVSLDKRTSFLSCRCIVYLLKSYATQLQSKLPGELMNISEEQPPAPPSARQSLPSPRDSEASRGKENRVARFAFQNCLRYLKSIMANQPTGQTTPSCLLATDWQLLAESLFHVILALKLSSTDATTSGSQDASKEKGKFVKGKKVDFETGEGLMLTALKCLEEVIRIASRRECLVEVIKQMGANGIPDEQDDSEPDEGLISKGEMKETIFQGADAKLIHHWLTTRCRPLFEELLACARYSEVEVFSGILQSLASKLPQALMKKHGAWAHLMCKGRRIRHIGAARCLTSMAICLSPPPDDIPLAQELGVELLKVTGSEETEERDRSDEYPMINKVTRSAIASLLLHKVESVLVDVEWLAAKLKIQATSEIPQLERKTSLRPGGSQRMLMEETLHVRMETLLLLLSIFTTMTLKGVLAEQLLKVTMRFYKCFAAATRLLIAPKGFTQALPSSNFQRLADLTCKKLTTSIYIFMSSRQRDEQEGAAFGKGSVSQIKREGRTIPNLIFHIEESERYLLQLSKVSKVNLLRFAKRSTARDFKIIGDGKKRKASPSTAQDAGNDGGGDEGSAEESEDGQESPRATAPAEGDEEDEDDAPEAEDDVGARSDDLGQVNRASPEKSESPILQESDENDSEDEVPLVNKRKKQRIP